MDSIENVVKGHSRELFAYIYRFVRNRACAEDILGETFVRLIEEYRKVKDGDFMWRPWLYKVATNCSISHLRKQKIRSFIPIFGREDSLPQEDDKCEETEKSQNSHKLQTAIEKLGKRHRSVLIMRIYQELSYEEIALALDINVGTVRSRINEAKKKLKIFMEDCYGT